MSRLLDSAGDLLLGARCPGCRTPGWGLCRSCRDRLAGHRPFRSQPDPCPADFPITVSSAAYDELLQRLIIAHKERQALALTTLLGERLALAVRGLLTLRPTDQPIVLVPVPSSRRAVRDRGFDATTAMARRAAARLSTRYRLRVVSALAQAGTVRDQAGLDAGQRQANLAGGLRVRRMMGGSTAIIVDDLVTTGASLTEAARVIAEQGGRVLGAATVAATQRRGAR